MTEVLRFDYETKGSDPAMDDQQERLNDKLIATVTQMVESIQGGRAEVSHVHTMRTVDDQYVLYLVLKKPAEQGGAANGH